jgi:signal transduction histidine kinase
VDLPITAYKSALPAGSAQQFNFNKIGRGSVMKRMVIHKAAVLAAFALIALAGGSAWAADRATAKEAEAMVKKAVAYIKANGKDKGYTEITNKSSAFHDRDLYVYVTRLDGINLAHGTNEKMVGKDTSEFKDLDGKEYVRERLELAKTKTSFWQDYKYSDPLTKKPEPKSAYCERLDDALVCGGIYKP